MRILIALFVIAFAGTINAQDYLSKYTGEWKSTLYIYNFGEIKDSVKVHLSVKPIADGKYAWKTVYASKDFPRVKDYKMFKSAEGENLFIMDEGSDGQLSFYLVEDKLTSVYEVQHTMLTTSYELKDGQIFFEVTSGIAHKLEGELITNYSIGVVQKAVFEKRN